MNTTGGKSAHRRRWHFGESISSGSKLYGFGGFSVIFFKHNISAGKKGAWKQDNLLPILSKVALRG
jgi:hypothetical protein